MTEAREGVGGGRQAGQCKGASSLSQQQAAAPLNSRLQQCQVQFNEPIANLLLSCLVLMFTPLHLCG